MRKPRRRRKPFSAEQLGNLADKVVKDLRFNVIGWDSCALAVRLLQYRLAAIGVGSQPLQCVLHVCHNDIDYCLCSHDDPKQPGHMILRVRDWLVDLTFDQLHEKYPAVPAIGTVGMYLHEPIEGFSKCSMERDGMQIAYHIDQTRPLFVLGSLDWSRSHEQLETMVQKLAIYPPDAIRKALNNEPRRREGDQGSV